MTTPKIINFAAVRSPFVVWAQALCDAFNEHRQDKQGFVVNDVKALQEGDAVVFLIGYTEVDLVAAESLQRESSIKPNIFIVANVPENSSLAEILLNRAQERLGGKIMEMPNKQELLPAFVQSLFDDSEGPDDLPDDLSYAALIPDDSPRLSLLTAAEMLGFPLPDICKLESERLPYELDLPNPYAESAEETQAKAMRIISNNTVIKQSNQFHFKRRLLLLSFIALCDIHRKNNHPDENQMYSKVVFMKTDDDKDIMPLLILVEIMHVEYKILKKDQHYSVAKIMKGISGVEDSAVKNFLSALLCHVLLKNADEEKAVSLRRQFDNAFLQMTEAQKDFFRTPEARIVAKIHNSVKDIL